jgi:hypothetical protein
MARRRWTPSYRGARDEPLSWAELEELLVDLFGSDVHTVPSFPHVIGHTSVRWRDRDLQILEADSLDQLGDAYAAFETSDITVATLGRAGFQELEFYYVPFKGEATVTGRTMEESEATRVVEAMKARFSRRLPLGEMDVDYLAGRKTHLEELDASSDPQARGRAFDGLMAEILEGHGCTTEVGRTADGEQTDVFVLKPNHLLLECKWQAKPVEPKEIMVLQAKLRERHAAVMGLFVSMSGFTNKALEKASDTGDRVLLCADRSDVESWLDGRVWFKKWWDSRVDLLVQRYGRN